MFPPAMHSSRCATSSCVAPADRQGALLDLTPGRRGNVDPPLASASFAEKMDYYRAQHTTRGIRATHLVGIPGVAFSLPVVLIRPRVGVPVFLASWALQVTGHLMFEDNSPALTKG